MVGGACSCVKPKDPTVAPGTGSAAAPGIVPCGCWYCPRGGITMRRFIGQFWIICSTRRCTWVQSISMGISATFRRLALYLISLPPMATTTPPSLVATDVGRDHGGAGDDATDARPPARTMHEAMTMPSGLHHHTASHAAPALHHPTAHPTAPLRRAGVVPAARVAARRVGRLLCQHRRRTERHQQNRDYPQSFHERHLPFCKHPKHSLDRFAPPCLSLYDGSPAAIAVFG